MVNSVQCPPDPSDHCNSNVLPNMFPQLQTQSCGVHTVGPLEITNREVRIVGGKCAAEEGGAMCSW